MGLIPAYLNVQPETRSSERFSRLACRKRPAATVSGTASPGTCLKVAMTSVLSCGRRRYPEEAERVRVRLLGELAVTGEPFVATHLSFPSVCRVAVAGEVFRWVPAVWEY